MELPTSIEHCHRMIRDLADENAVLRKSGNDFGHLAERLNSALQEERRYASEHPLTRKAVRTSIRTPRPIVGEDSGGRWSAGGAGGAGLQIYAGSPGTIHSRQVRTPARAPRPRPVKWVL